MQGKESPEIGETTSEVAVAIIISPCIVGDGAAVEEDNDFSDFLETDFNKSDDEFGETLARKEEEPQGKESPENGKLTFETVVAVSISSCVVDNGTAAEEDDDFGAFHETY